MLCCEGNLNACFLVSLQRGVQDGGGSGGCEWNRALRG